MFSSQVNCCNPTQLPTQVQVTWYLEPQLNPTIREKGKKKKWKIKKIEKLKRENIKNEKNGKY